MEEKVKKIFWISFIPIGLVFIGLVFGIIAAMQLTKTNPEDEALKILQYVMITIIIIAALIALISGLINAISMKNGHVKNAVLATARNSVAQTIGPIASFILGMLGLAKAKAAAGFFIFLIIAFMMTLFSSGLIVGTLRWFKKDKENYTYISVVAFIAAGMLFVFAIASIIGQLQIGQQGDTHFVGFLICFSLFFVLGDLVSFINLGVLARIATKYAPKVTEESSDASVFKEMNSSLKEIQEGLGKKQTENTQVDVASELRKYKGLLDEGIITQEEFDAKKKELL